MNKNYQGRQGLLLGIKNLPKILIEENAVHNKMMELEVPNQIWGLVGTDHIVGVPEKCVTKKYTLDLIDSSDGSLYYCRKEIITTNTVMIDFWKGISEIMAYPILNIQ